MSRKIVCLTDADGEIRWFEETDLNNQLAKAEMLPAGALKTMISSFVQDVRNMMDEQQNYFKATHGTPEKARLLEKCKKLEKAVREKCQHIVPTMAKLSN